MPSAPKQWGKKPEVRSKQSHERRKKYRTKPWGKTRIEVFTRDGWICQSCGKIITEKGEAHCDHIEEISLPEEVVCDIDKLQTLCARCHSRKTRKAMGR